MSASASSSQLSEKSDIIDIIDKSIWWARNKSTKKNEKNMT